VTKVVVPAAGLGTRFLPATKALPKEMLPVVDKPTIQYVVEEAVAAGLTDVLMITGRNKNALENHFDRAFELESTLLSKGDVSKLQNVTRSTDLVHMASTLLNHPRVVFLQGLVRSRGRLFWIGCSRGSRPSPTPPI
jgi:UTP--glucose-1-phosphate uridylyltransferase